MAGLQAEEENAADAHVRRRQGIQEGVTSGREDVLIRSSRVGLNLAGVSRVRPFRILDISGRLIFRIALDGFEVVRLGLVEEAHGVRDPGERRIPHLGLDDRFARSEEHTSELQSLMSISYAVFCLYNKIQHI